MFTHDAVQPLPQETSASAGDVIHGRLKNHRSRLLHNLRQLLLWLVAAITAGCFLIISTTLVFFLLFSGQKSDKTIVFVNQIQNEEINPIIITQLSYSPPKAAVVWGSWSVRLPNASQLLADSPKAELLRTRSTLS